MEIYLIRHLPTTIENGYCYGQSDIPLQQPFLATHDKIVNYFKGQNLAVYSSPLDRCKQLAYHFKIYIDSVQKIQFDNRLKEMNFGTWELKKWDDINQEELNKWMTGFVHEKTPEGESFTELNQRVKEFIDEIIFTHDEEDKIIIVTHAGVIRSVLCQVLEIPLKNAFKIPIEYGSHTKIKIDKKTDFQSIEYINRDLNISI